MLTQVLIVIQPGTIADRSAQPIRHPPHLDDLASISDAAWTKGRARSLRTTTSCAQVHVTYGNR